MNAANRLTASRLLQEDDPPPVIAQNPGGSSPHVVICDHAGRAIPARLGRLGLGDSPLEQHIAWDIGAGAVAARLGERLDAAVLLQAYSRLVIDCNRPLAAPSLIAEVSDGVVIPGNAGLSADERGQRIAEIFEPYHDAVDSVIQARQDGGRPVSVIAVHSFTPVMDGVERPWTFGVLHGGDSGLSRRVLELMRRQGLDVGENEPYALGPLDYSIPRHAQARGLDYLELEIRQDLIAGDAGQAWAAELIASILRDAPALPAP